MNIPSSFKFSLAALATAGAALAPAVSHAQTQPAAMGASEWKTALTLYAYLPTIGGSTSFPTLPGNPSPSISVDGSTIIDHLKMTFMGSLDIHNGKWGAFTDILYVDIGGNKSKTRDFSIDGAPGTLSGDLSLDVKGTLWTLAGEYRMATSDPAFTVDVLAGARMFNMKNTLGWNFTGTAGSHPLAGRSGSTAVSDTLWDAIVGVKGNYTFGAERQWFVPFYFDIGTGQSDLTYQIVGGIGYRYKWGDVVAAWRYIDYNMKSGSAIQSMNFNGPMIGATWRW
ncbi:MAG: hypothetical protein IPF39_06435 [Comamonadaceae bacterium]|jgi:hypothetical protein|uniref:hypothetical protein n=1 Tax=Candidatus Skiveiella danica TaxID=3386177 RepID=UPI001B5C4263|nr:hypothetical protein [Comamonadaceae bacterium]MBP8100719.1 hypothetical protein [Burkholderiaceae bacterium]